MLVVESKTHEMVCFSELNKSEVFKTFEGYFEKITELNQYNAINLRTGDLDYFNDSTIVIKVNGSFVER